MDTPMKYGVTEQLHPATADLVNRFATALAAKLLRSQQKYGYTDGWSSTDWEHECRMQMMDHIPKGDPLDVAAYCAFLWHHGWPTMSHPAPSDEPRAGRHAIVRHIALDEQLVLF